MAGVRGAGHPGWNGALATSVDLRMKRVGRKRRNTILHSTGHEYEKQGRLIAEAAVMSLVRVINALQQLPAEADLICAGVYIQRRRMTTPLRWQHCNYLRINSISTPASLLLHRRY